MCLSPSPPPRLLLLLQFVPFSGDRSLLTGAEDKELKLHDLHSFETTQVPTLCSHELPVHTCTLFMCLYNVHAHVITCIIIVKLFLCESNMYM